MGLPFIFYNYIPIVVAVEITGLYPTGYDLWISQAVPTARYHGSNWATGTYAAGSNEVSFGQYEPWYGFRKMSSWIGGDSQLEAYAQNALTGWRDGYSVPNNYGVPGYYHYTDGFRLDWTQNADTGSKHACLRQSVRASYTPDSSQIDWLENEAASRETAYAILGYINSEVFCGTGHNPKFSKYMELILADSGSPDVSYGGYSAVLTSGGHIEQWLGGLQTDSDGVVVSGTENLHRFTEGEPVPATGIPTFYQGFGPFMGAITAWTLISAVENSGSISGGIPSGHRIIPKIERLFDGIWPYYWIEADKSMAYRWYKTSGVRYTDGSPELNNEMAPIYWWLYKKTGKQRHLDRGDALFNGTINFESLTYTGAANSIYSKHFNELVRWVFDGLQWRADGISTYGQNATMLSATSNEDGDTVAVSLSRAVTINDANGWSVETNAGAVPGLTYLSGSNSDILFFSAYPRIGGDSSPLLNISNVAGLNDVSSGVVVNNSLKPIPPYEYQVPAIASTLTGLSNGATVFNITGASMLTTLITGGTISGSTLSGAAAIGPVVIKLAAADYSGSFTFPAVSNTGWIYVVSANYDSLPSIGTRTQSGDRANMPLFYAGDNGGSYNFHFATMHIAYGANKYRFIGLAGTYPLTSDIGLGIFVAGKESSTLTGNYVSDSQIPRDIIIDRCEFYGRDGAGYTDTKGVTFDVEGGAIINSRIVGIAGNTADDPMGIMVSFAGRNLLFENLEVTASAENIIFGGTDGYRDVHDNIVVRKCWLHKPQHWFDCHPTYDGNPRAIKNLLELKKASKVLVEDCVLEDVGETDAGQSLTAFVLTVRNQSSGDLGAVVEHVEVTNCLVRRCGMMFSILGEDNNYPSLETNHLYLHNNLYYDQNYYRQYGEAVYPAIRLSSIYQGRQYPNIRIEHNTVVTGPSGTGTQYANFLDIVMTGTGTTNVIPGFVAKNNIFEGYGASTLREAISTNWPGNSWPFNVGIVNLSSGVYEFTNNLALGEDASERAKYPSGNFFETGYTTVGFTNYAGATGAIDFKLTSGNYRAGQPYAATDGTDLGANINTIEAIVSKTISGII